MRIAVRLAVVVLALPSVVLVGPSASASELPSRIEPVPVRMVPCDPNWIHIYRKTGQDRRRWGFRLAGTDLQKLILPAVRGEVSVNVVDADGSEPFIVPFDQHSPFSRYVYVTGDTVTVNISVDATPPNGNGCAHTFKFGYAR